MEHSILSDSFSRLQIHLDRYLANLQTFLESLAAERQLQVVVQLRGNLWSPFLFVVVGEVKSGKSSFINALLEEDVCQVDAAPCTDIIQQIQFSETPYEESPGPLVKRIGLPLQILKSVAIVDTPGTNTVIENHQEITRNFIPNSDLVILVFPAKNPYTQTAWDLVDFIQEEWRRKIILVLQQADLAREDELRTNVKKVRELALAKGIPNPEIFVTSAEKEFRKDAGSGFDSVRAYIRNTVTGGRQYRLKLESILEATGRVLAQVEVSMEERQEALTKDREIVEGIRHRLAAGHKQSAYELQNLIQRLAERYRQTAADIKKELREGLSVSGIFQMSFSSIFNRRRSLQSWLSGLQDTLDQKLREEFNRIAEEGAEHFAEGVRQLLRGLTATLRHDMTGRSISDDDIFARISQRRMEVIQAVRDRLGDMDSKESMTRVLKEGSESIAPSLMGGGILAVIGAVILAVTHSIFFDITGGLLTGTGLFLAGGVLFVRKGKIIQQFEEGLDRGGEQLVQELNERLSAKLHMVYDDIDRSFLPLYDYVRQEEERLGPVLERLEEAKTGHRKALELIEKELNEP
ncbi:MAG: dynamin family protein [Desulfobacterales bacterium]